MEITKRFVKRLIWSFRNENETNDKQVEMVKKDT